MINVNRLISCKLWRMKIIFRLIFCLFLLGGFSSCEKFSEGGAKKKAETNLTNIWVIDAYFHNGLDKTDNLVISNFEETFAEDRKSTRLNSSHVKISYAV